MKRARVTRPLWQLTLVSLALGCGSAGDGFPEADEGSNYVSESGVSVGLLEAESFTAQSGCKKATNKTGYTGSGFVDYGGNGTWIEFNNVKVAAAGNYTLKFRYATASGSRQCAVSVNGANVKNVPFSSTGSWTSWGTESISVALKAGNNTIRIAANTGSGGPNLDSMDVLSTSSGPCANTLLARERLDAAQFRCSTDGKYQFGLSSNGNLALLSGSQTLWSANTTGAAYASMQADGNLVVRDSSGSAKWSSKTAGKSGATLTVETNGTAVIRHNGSVVWSVGGSVGPVDNCPNDPNKTEPGQCGCGVPEGSCNEASKGIRFVAYGDSRTNKNDHQNVLDAIAKRTPQVVLNTGDLWDGYGASTWKSAVTKNSGLGALLNNNLFLVSRGNHESVSEVLNFSPPIVRNKSEIYSFTVGNTFFVSLGYATSSGSSFLEQKLKTAEAAKATWRVVFSHVPVYSGGAHGADGISAIERVCDRYNVNLFFNGHDHIYERSHQMYGQQISDDGNQLDAAAGTVYVVAGGGGAPLYSGSRIHSTHTSKSALHFVEVTTTPTTLTAKAIQPSGTVIDSFSLAR